MNSREYRQSILDISKYYDFDITTRQIEELVNIHDMTDEIKPIVKWTIPTSDNRYSPRSHSKKIVITKFVNSVYCRAYKTDDGELFQENEFTTSKEASYLLAFQRFPHAKFFAERCYES